MRSMTWIEALPSVPGAGSVLAMGVLEADTVGEVRKAGRGGSGPVRGDVRHGKRVFEFRLVKQASVRSHQRLRIYFGRNKDAGATACGRFAAALERAAGQRARREFVPHPLVEIPR